MRRNYQNDAPTLTLDGGITDSATSIVVLEDVSTLDVPLAYVIDPGGANEEAVVVTAADAGTKTLTVQRGFDGYAAVAHADAETMEHMVIATDVASLPMFTYKADLQNGDFSGTDSKALGGPLLIEADLLISGIAGFVNTAGDAAATLDIGIYNTNRWGMPTTLWDYWSLPADTAGTKTQTFTPKWLRRGIYFLLGLPLGATPPVMRTTNYMPTRPLLNRRNEGLLWPFASFVDDGSAGSVSGAASITDLDPFPHQDPFSDGYPLARWVPDSDGPVVRLLLESY